MPAKHKDHLIMLIGYLGLHINNSPVRLRPGGPGLQHAGLGVDGISDKDRGFVIDMFIIQIGDGTPADIRDANPYGKAKHQRTHNEDLSVLVSLSIRPVYMNRMMVHRQQAKQIIIALKNGFRGFMLYHFPRGKLLKKSTDLFHKTAPPTL